MRSIFIIVLLVMGLCCPLWAAEQHCMQQEAGSTGGPDMHEDSGLTWYQVAGLIAALGTSTALGWQGCKKMNAIRIEPQPLEVKRIAECATRKELDDFKTEVREDFRRVHNRIDNNDRATAEIKGKLDVIAQNQQKLIDLITNRHG